MAAITLRYLSGADIEAVALTAEEITVGLCENFNVAFPAAHRDVLATLEKLRQAQLLDSS